MAVDALRGMPSQVAERLRENDLCALAQAAAQEPGGMPRAWRIA
jgi:hypothetical protein